MRKESIIFVLAKQNPSNTAFVGQKYPTTYTVKSESTILNENGVPERIRYAEGEKSIFVNKQTDYAKRAAGFTFVDGLLRVSTTEKTKLEYLRTAAENEDNHDSRPHNVGVKYKELDFERDAKNQLSKDLLMAKAGGKFIELQEKPEILRAIARINGIMVSKERGFTFQSQLLNVVNSDPKTFLDLVGDHQKMEQAVRLDLIFEMQDADYINFGLNKWSWSGKRGNSTIIEVPTGRNAHDYLAEYTFKGAQGKVLAETFKGLLAGDADESEKVDVAAITQKEKELINRMSDTELKDACKKAGIIEFENNVFTYHGRQFANKSKANADILESMSKDDSLLHDLRRDLLFYNREQTESEE